MKTKTEQNPKKIVIIDDHPVVREGLAMCIANSPDLTVCGEASDVPDGLKIIAETKPDLAIVDISLKTGNGIELIKRLQGKYSKMRILVWSMHNETLYAERALRAGAMGYITKENATDKIMEAIRRVLSGQVYLSETMANQLLNRAVGKHDTLSRSPIDTLSDRELEVFRLIGQGQDTRKISKQMRLSPKTIETYRARVKLKLNVSTAPELIRRAVQWVEQGT